MQKKKKKQLSLLGKGIWDGMMGGTKNTPKQGRGEKEINNNNKKIKIKIKNMIKQPKQINKY